MKPSSHQYHDLTTELSPQTVVYPGDPAFNIENICSLEDGSPVHLCQLHFGNHLGTHIDFPSHVIKHGKTSSDFAIDHLIGAGVIIEVPENIKSINREFIKSQTIHPGDIVFFKTSNKNISKQAAFTENYVYIEPNAAEELLIKQAKIVGIDYLSVDQHNAHTLPVHHMLLLGNILIIENLNLKNAPAGRCEIFILPLNISNLDGLPVRVIARM